MKVQFFIYENESDVYDFPDDCSKRDLDEAVLTWIENAVTFGWKIVEEDNKKEKNEIYN